jgi:hypothetical protein
MKKTRVARPRFGVDDEDNDDNEHAHYKSKRITVRMLNSGWITDRKVRCLHVGNSHATIDTAVREMLGRTVEQWARLNGEVYDGPLLPYNPRKVKLITPPRLGSTLQKAITDLCGRECLFSILVQYREFPADGNIVKTVLLMVTEVTSG